MLDRLRDINDIKCVCMIEDVVLGKIRMYKSTVVEESSYCQEKILVEMRIF